MSLGAHSGYYKITVIKVPAYGIVQSVEVKECQRIWQVCWDAVFYHLQHCKYQVVGKPSVSPAMCISVTNNSEKPVPSILRVHPSIQKMKTAVPPICWYPTSKLHAIIYQKTIIYILQVHIGYKLSMICCSKQKQEPP